MRIPIYSAAFALLALSAVSLQAGGSCGGCAGGGCQTQCGAHGCQLNGGCGGCGGGKHGHGDHVSLLYGRLYPGLDRHFNCGCQGSYKYPVPPLSTYHWPGLYSHQLMTEYHSPWRFPPIKRYSDEKLEIQPDDSPIPGGPEREALPPAAAYRSPATNVQQVDFAAPSLKPGQTESVSLKLRRVSQASP